VLNKRIKRALELRQNGLSFIKIGEDLGIGPERARQIVRKYQRHLKLLEDPLALKIKELSRLSDATRILNALKGNDFYDGDPQNLAHYKPEDLMKIRGLGMKSVAVIAEALESIGVIRNAEEWLKGYMRNRRFET
jgi:DNA-directed RNA polymerase alpha subunit